MDGRTPDLTVLLVLTLLSFPRTSSVCANKLIYYQETSLIVNTSSSLSRTMSELLSTAATDIVPPPRRSSTYTETLQSLQAQVETKLSSSTSPPATSSAYSDFIVEGFTTMGSALPPYFCSNRVLPSLNSKFQEAFSLMHANGHIPSEEPNPPLTHQSDCQSMPLSTTHGFKEIVRRSSNRYEMTFGLEEEEGNSEVPSLRSEILGNLNPNLFDLLDLIFDTPPSSSHGSDACTYDLQSLSAVYSLPGAANQQWHVDGGHMNKKNHMPPHILNVFVPLLELSMELGPTEVKPCSHVYTRDLFRFILGAKASEEGLRQPVTPLVASSSDKPQLGSALIFDYRTLHRGLGNSTPSTTRPVLVLTFKLKWFKDMLNFPLFRSLRDESPVVRVGDGSELPPLPFVECDVLFVEFKGLRQLVELEDCSSGAGLELVDWLSMLSGGSENLTTTSSIIDRLPPKFLQCLSSKNIFRIVAIIRNDDQKSTPIFSENKGITMKRHKIEALVGVDGKVQKVAAKTDKYGCKVGGKPSDIIVFTMKVGGGGGNTSCYLEVGKMYTKIRAGDADDEFVVMVDERSNSANDLKLEKLNVWV
jgi:hypothetical protein